MNSSITTNKELQVRGKKPPLGANLQTIRLVQKIMSFFDVQLHVRKRRCFCTNLIINTSVTASNPRNTYIITATKRIITGTDDDEGTPPFGTVLAFPFKRFRLKSSGFRYCFELFLIFSKRATPCSVPSLNKTWREN